MDDDGGGDDGNDDDNDDDDDDGDDDDDDDACNVVCGFDVRPAGASRSLLHGPPTPFAAAHQRGRLRAGPDERQSGGVRRRQRVGARPGAAPAGGTH
jgi:hypothetical protein